MIARLPTRSGTWMATTRLRAASEVARRGYATNWGDELHGSVIRQGLNQPPAIEEMPGHEMKTLPRNGALEDLVLRATGCASLAKALRDNADRQRTSADQLHGDARKLEALCQTLRDDVSEIKQNLPSGQGPTSISRSIGGGHVSAIVTADHARAARRLRRSAG